MSEGNAKRHTIQASGREITEAIHNQIIKRIDQLPEPPSALTIEHITRAKAWLSGQRE